jgi:hypothetical protein
VDNQPDLFTLVEAQTLNNEIKRLTDLNKLLITLAQELGAADDVAAWNDAWNRLAKIIIAEKNK